MDMYSCIQQQSFLVEQVKFILYTKCTMMTKTNIQMLSYQIYNINIEACLIKVQE